nr:hypothetical protein [bacterium]
MKVIRRDRYLIAFGVIAILVAACNFRPSNEDDLRESNEPTSQYLQEEIAPCTSIPGSSRDPCAVQPTPALLSGASVIYTEIPAYWDLYFDSDSSPSVFTPHLVVRASFLPGTTRCSVYKREFPAFIDFALASDNRLLTCFIDVRVNDYLIGKGPPTLSIAAYIYPFIYVGEDTFDYAASHGPEAARTYEGREGVLFLAPSLTTVVEALWMTEFWDVQRTGDAVKVLAPYKELIERSYRDKFTEENLALLDRPLDEFETVISKGAVARAAETGGRIAVGDDLPMLITDANLLRPYYEGPGVGISYETDAPLLPPPVPGAEDPEQPPVTTGEEDGSSGSVPVPGEEDQPDGGGGGAGP